MFTVSCITAAGHLNPQVVKDLAQDWHGTQPRVLSPGEAEEFSVQRIPSEAPNLRAEFAKMGIDLNILPSANRKKRLLLADMDGTIIEQECIDELAEQAGVGAQVAQITARAMAGELGFDGALTERVALLRGLPESVITQVLDDRIFLARGARVLVQTMRKFGAHCTIVSGGFTDFAAEIARRVGFHDYKANHLEITHGRLTGEVIPPILGREAKRQTLQALTRHLGITPDQVVAVGDGANDLAMLESAGLGVALHAKPALAAACDIRVDHADLTAVLFLQGYAREDFTT